MSYADDDAVIVDLDHPLRMSADCLRALRKATGRTMTDLLQDDDDEVTRFQVMAFAELYRRFARLGHLPDSAEIWDRAGAVDLDFPAAVVDPTPEGPSTTSPRSAGTGE
jgi:hypothetical protein